jgi:predicted nucleic acid-binding protein
VFTLDASVWVNAFDLREPGHEVSRQLLELLSLRRLPVVVPTLALVEVAGAISRTRGDVAGAQTFAQALGSLPNVAVLPLDAPLAERALALAAQHGLRGADAVYAATAAEAGCRLITLDNEQLTRLGGVVAAATPAVVVNELTAELEEPDVSA